MICDCFLSYISNDLLEPSNDVKSKPEIIDDSSVVDPQPLYKQPDIPNMSVREIKVALENEEEKHNFCLDRSQREAVYKALSHPLTVIQVYNTAQCIQLTCMIAISF